MEKLRDEIIRRLKEYNNQLYTIIQKEAIYREQTDNNIKYYKAWLQRQIDIYSEMLECLATIIL